MWSLTRWACNLHRANGILPLQSRQHSRMHAYCPILSGMHSFLSRLPYISLQLTTGDLCVRAGGCRSKRSSGSARLRYSGLQREGGGSAGSDGQCTGCPVQQGGHIQLRRPAWHPQQPRRPAAIQGSWAPPGPGSVLCGHTGPTKHMSAYGMASGPVAGVKAVEAGSQQVIHLNSVLNRVNMVAQSAALTNPSN